MPKKRTKKYSQKLRNIRAAQTLVADLLIVSVIDTAGGTLVPQTFAMKKGSCELIELTNTQKRILHDLRHSWCFFSAVACRQQDGSRYLKDASEAYIEQQYNLADLTSVLADIIYGKFRNSNTLHTLTTYWVSSPCNHDFTSREMLAPLYYADVYGEFLSQYELENNINEVKEYKADNLDQFIAEWR